MDMEACAVEKCRRVESCSEEKEATAPTPQDYKSPNALLQGIGKLGAHYYLCIWTHTLLHTLYTYTAKSEILVR